VVTLSHETPWLARRGFSLVIVQISGIGVGYKWRQIISTLICRRIDEGVVFPFVVHSFVAHLIIGVIYCHEDAWCLSSVFLT
jgi:hypothetical protein